MNPRIDLKSLAESVSDYSDTDRAIALMHRRRRRRYSMTASAATVAMIAAGSMAFSGKGPTPSASPPDPCRDAPITAAHGWGTPLGSTARLIRRQDGMPSRIFLSDGRSVDQGDADSSSPDGRWIGGPEPGAYLAANTLNGRALRVQPCTPNPTTAIKAVAWSPGGQFLLLAQEPALAPDLYILNVVTGEQRRVKLPQDTNPVALLDTGQVLSVPRAQAPTRQPRTLDLSLTGTPDPIKVRPGNKLPPSEFLGTYESTPQILTSADEPLLWIATWTDSGERAALRTTLTGTVVERTPLHERDRIVGTSRSALIVQDEKGALHRVDQQSRDPLEPPAPGDVISTGLL
ncbi:hypothetical protein GCM10027589_05560 [Actinocorallia lasiicapitis]